MFWYFTRILCRIKSLHRVKIVLPFTYQKTATVFLYKYTSKIRDGDDANRPDKIFQTQTDKKCFRTPIITFLTDLIYQNTWHLSIKHILSIYQLNVAMRIFTRYHRDMRFLVGRHHDHK